MTAATNTTEPSIHLIEGPVGAGKSTFAGKLALDLGALHIDLDAWMVTLFRPDRPDDGFMQWYSERKQRCLDQIWQLASEILATGNSVVLELGLVQRALRDAFYAQVDITDHRLCVYWLDVPESVRWQRVQQRNTDQSSTYKMTVTEEIFAMANSAWEAPDELECEQRAITLVS